MSEGSKGKSPNLGGKKRRVGANESNAAATPKPRIQEKEAVSFHNKHIEEDSGTSDKGLLEMLNV